MTTDLLGYDVTIDSTTGIYNLKSNDQPMKDGFQVKGPFDAIAPGIVAPPVTINGPTNQPLTKLPIAMWNSPSGKSFPINYCAESKIVNPNYTEKCFSITDNFSRTRNTVEIPPFDLGWQNKNAWHSLNLYPQYSITLDQCLELGDKCPAKFRKKNTWNTSSDETKIRFHENIKQYLPSKPPGRATVEYKHKKGWSWAKQISRCCMYGGKDKFDRNCQLADGTFITKDHPKCEVIMNGYCSAYQSKDDAEACGCVRASGETRYLLGRVAKSLNTSVACLYKGCTDGIGWIPPKLRFDKKPCPSGNICKIYNSTDLPKRQLKRIQELHIVRGIDRCVFAEPDEKVSANMDKSNINGIHSDTYDEKKVARLEAVRPIGPINSSNFKGHKKIIDNDSDDDKNSDDEKIKKTAQMTAQAIAQALANAKVSSTATVTTAAEAATITTPPPAASATTTPPPATAAAPPPATAAAAPPETKTADTKDETESDETEEESEGLSSTTIYIIVGVTVLFVIIIAAIIMYKSKSNTGQSNQY